MTTKPTIYPQVITDLSQVRWYVQGEAPDLWVVGDATQAGQRSKAFVLHVARADCSGDGGDCSSWLAEEVAMKLSETDETIRWQRDRAVDYVNSMRRVESAAAEVLALLRDRNVCSPGPAFEVALGELSRAMDARGT